ncbi:MAG TPA: xanthine dehydrogenase family protein subunit M [Vicinamibacterales bacterium]|nr:xanthine dehydrogenase family protein subunit M [Vicinamibacterales bacterium]
MATIHDVMPMFALYQPESVDDAVRLLDQFGATAWVMAGGMDTFDWLKDRTKRTDAVIELSNISELQGIKEAAGGLDIGAMTTLTDLAAHPVIRERFRLLSDAAGLVASPQIRNQGTLGGNITQDARCWYYRSGWPCYRAGGNICYADTPTAINREHAILHADRCVAVSPSDTAPALIALDATMVIRSTSGERRVAARDYFIGPGVDITKLTVIQPGELLTAIHIPADWAGAEFYFEKVRDRQVWDFPLVNIAAAMKVSGSTIQSARVVVGAVAATPVRLGAVEQFVAGRARSKETAEAAGRMAVEGAVALAHNGYKIPLMRNLVMRAIRGSTPATT